MLNRPCVIAQQIKLGLGSPENAYVCASLKELADQGRPNETCGARYQLLHDGNAAYPAKLIRRAPHDVPWYGLVSVKLATDALKVLSQVLHKATRLPKQHAFMNSFAADHYSIRGLCAMKAETRGFRA